MHLGTNFNELIDSVHHNIVTGASAALVVNDYAHSERWQVPWSKNNEVQCYFDKPGGVINVIVCHLYTENKFLNTEALQSRIVGICVGQKASDRYAIIEC